MEKYKIGQRWISEMEPELGLGIVTHIDNRIVKIHFPASDCIRQYAIPAAPIIRVQFKAGDTIKSRTGYSFTIESTTIKDGIIIYAGENQKLPENELCDSLSFTTPQERLLNGFVDENRDFNLRYNALLNQHNSRKSWARGFIGGRIDLIPHQLYVVSEITSRQKQRVLLSDEVGLGKTIEACLILHRLIISGRISRVLILVPQSLVHQWFIELLRKFNLLFRIFDKEYCESIESAEPASNPFLEDQLGICCLDFLTSSDKRKQQALAAGWDMVVIDEAHHLTEQSPAYLLVEQISERTKGLLLLTATPEQLGHRSHFARLRLLDPARYYDFNLFEQEEENYMKIAEITNKLLDGFKLNNEDIEILTQLLTANTIDARNEMAASLQKHEHVRTNLIDDLLDRYGVGRAVFRNTRAAMPGFPERIAHLVPLVGSEKDLTRQTKEFGFDINKNAEGFTYDYKNDSRVIWLVKLLKKLKTEKVLLICSSEEKVLAIDEALRKEIKINIALFHENLSLLQRDRNAAWFAQKDGAQILICSEIGSEGRNFQFCHQLVLFDLPLNPELLEQRIGRLDRIGQKQTIQIHIPYITGTEYEVLVKWYHEGLNTFEKNIPGLYQIYQVIGDQVKELALSRQQSQLIKLIETTRKKCAEVKQQLEKGRDRLLELNSFRPKKAESLSREIKIIDIDRTIDKFLLTIFNKFGIRAERLSDRTYKLNLLLLSNHEFPLPVGRQDSLTVTFDRETANSHENIEFLTWDHPMVIGAMDLILGSEKGNSTFANWPDADSQEIILEAIFVLECVAPAGLHIDRFLPPTPVRIVVNHLLKDCSRTYPVKQFDKCLKNGTDSHILDEPRIKQELFPMMLKKCNEMAGKRVSAITKTAMHKMETTLIKEVHRLLELKKVNTNITEEEILLCKQEIELLKKNINSARLRLDALRFICRGEFQ